MLQSLQRPALWVQPSVADCVSKQSARDGTPPSAYGKLTDLGRDYPVLMDVYYIKSGMDPKTKDVKNVLIRRGNELHGPDRMYLNGRHILLIEPVGPLSSVAKLIAESKNQ